MTPTSSPSTTHLRSARIAGVAITTSPTQLGKNTPSRINELSPAETVKKWSSEL
jgi:hypothetical protein